MSTLEMNTLQMNTVVNYTLNDYVTLIMTIMNYMFVHDKMTYWMENMNEKTMSTFIQVNFMMGMTLFTYSYVCFFYNDFVRGLYTTMWSFLMFYNILMAQIKLMNRVQLNTVVNSSTDDSDTSDDDEMDVDEEGGAFEEEVLKNQDEKIVENIVNKILEIAGEKANEREVAETLAVAEILVNEFMNTMNSLPEVPVPAPEVVDTAPEVVNTAPEVVNTAPEVVDTAPEVVNTAPEVVDTAPEVIQDTVQQSEEENSVSDSPNAETTPIEN